MAICEVNRRTGVLIVDDHPLILAALAQVIDREHDLVCSGTANTVVKARKAFDTYKPDLVTIDLGMPDGDVFQLIKDFAAERPSVPILVVSQCDEAIYAERVLKAGARGYVTKERCVEDIILAIRAILNGELFVSQKVAALALHQMAGRKVGDNKSSIHSLSDRELQILRLLGAGLGTRVISIKLNLSIKTIESHRENIKHKLKIRDAATLVHYATTWVDSQTLRPRQSQGNP
jgi:DNA-binding NarL/FixJ family response regulator